MLVVNGEWGHLSAPADHFLQQVYTGQFPGPLIEVMFLIKCQMALPFTGMANSRMEQTTWTYKWHYSVSHPARHEF